jgi:hypothetical protein
MTHLTEKEREIKRIAEIAASVGFTNEQFCIADIHQLLTTINDERDKYKALQIKMGKEMDENASLRAEVKALREIERAFTQSDINSAIRKAAAIAKARGEHE